MEGQRYSPRVHVILHAYSSGDNNKRVTRVSNSQFTTMEQKREREIETLGSGNHCTSAWTSRVASGVENGYVAPPFAECGTLSYFRRCATSSLVFYGPMYVASWFVAFRAFRSHILFFLLRRYELRTSVTRLVLSPAAQRCTRKV